MKNIILGAVAVVVTIVGVSFAGKPSVNVTTPTPVVNVQVPDQKVPVVNVSVPNQKTPIVNVEAPNITLPKTIFGATGSGQDTDSHQYFNGGLSAGGYYSTTSTASTYTILPRDLQNAPTFISWLPDIVTTISIGSTSTRPYVPKIGDTASIYIRNASSTYAGTITLAAADGGLVLKASTSTLVVSGLQVVRLNLLRVATNLVVATIDQWY